METFVAKRDHQHTYRTVVSRGANDSDVVFTMEISSTPSTDTGTLSIAGMPGEYTLFHKSLSGRWDMFDEQRCLVCTARKISKLRKKFILEELAPDDNDNYNGANVVVRKMRMQPRKVGSEHVYFHPIPTSMGDREAAKNEPEQVFMTITRKSTKSTAFVLQKKMSDPINPVFLAFLYGMFATDYKRYNDAINAGIIGGAIAELEI